MTDAPDTPVFVDYFDGQSAVPRRMELLVEPTRLTLVPAEGSPIVWPLDWVRCLPDEAVGGGLSLALVKGTPERLYVPAGATDLARHLRGTVPARPGLPPIPRFRLRLLALSSAALGSVAAILFLLIPVMADQLATLLPPEGERALGDSTLTQIRTALDESGAGELSFCDAPAGRAALDEMTARLSRHSDFPFPLSVHVLDHEMLNAFALPGGHIVFFRGLIEAAGDPDQVAAVLAHEMGHVAGRDATRGALRSAGSIGVLGLVFGDFAGGTLALFLANQLIDARYSQATESRADAYAFELLGRAGIAPGALGRFFETLEREYGAEGPGLAQHFSSHPAVRARIEAAAAVPAPASSSPALGPRAWQALRKICR